MASGRGKSGAGDRRVTGIGARIRAIRVRRGWTLRALARAAGIAPSIVSRTEDGSGAPSLASIVAICDALGITVGYLVDRGGQ